jgi:molybdopterin/thiamine biosynthesis adenylyltransferase
MLIKLLSHNAALQKLANEGFHIAWQAGHVLVRDVPYVDESRRVQRGTLIVKVEIDPDHHISMSDHTIFFSGVKENCPPCDEQGKPLINIANAYAPQDLAAGLKADRRFSAKPIGEKYPDIHAKVTTYVNILSSPVFAIDPTATALTFSPCVDSDEETPFHYYDTASTRAEITAASQKLEGQIISIVGVGGSGSYVLDLIAKTPVREIRLFDDDKFHTHNAFRCPGAPSATDLKEGKSKVEYLADIYSKMKRRIQPHKTALVPENVTLLAESTFVFLCIDNPAAKPAIMSYLRANNVPFIDVGMGLNLQGTSISGSLRVTTIDDRKHDHLGQIATEGKPEGVYAAAIQVAELNALTACLAVLRWKKLLGFYVDHQQERSATYSVKLNEVFNEEQVDPT